MPAPIDITGQRFGLLIALMPCTPRARNRYWRCRCDCGREVEVSLPNLKVATSCGCRQIRKTHGAWGSPEYWIFRAAMQRCSNPNYKQWKDYGGRGIEMRFSSFEEFIAHIGPRPGKSHSLDRINNDGHYEIGNVRWATRRQQQQNRRHPPQVGQEHGGPSAPDRLGTG